MSQVLNFISVFKDCFYYIVCGMEMLLCILAFIRSLDWPYGQNYFNDTMANIAFHCRSQFLEVDDWYVSLESFRCFRLFRYPFELG